MKVLDVKIDNMSHYKILEKIESFLDDGKFHQISTINPEFVLEAQKDKEFKDILNLSDLNVADGTGIWFAFLRFGKILKCRIAGADLMHEILRMADEKKLSVFLAANKHGLSSYEEVCNSFTNLYPNINFSGDNIDPKSFYKPSVKGYKLILCAFGAPFQEKFINSQKDDIIGVAMGVGGSFDFATGKIKRAPKMMRFFGLEWLWRLLLEPRYRFRRVFRAIIIFPIKVIFSKNA